MGTKVGRRVHVVYVLCRQDIACNNFLSASVIFIVMEFLLSFENVEAFSNIAVGWAFDAVLVMLRRNLFRHSAFARPSASRALGPDPNIS